MRGSRWTAPLPGWLSGLVLLGLAGSGVVLTGPALDAWDVPHPTLTSARSLARLWESRPAGWPPLSAEQRPTPWGTPPPAPGGGTFAFEHLQDDGVTPVAYDPCRALHVVVRPDGAPPGGQEMIDQGLATLAAATGLHIVLDGSTDEAPSPGRAAYQPDRYGERWAPALVAWVDPTQDEELAGDVAGLAGSAAYGLGGGPLVYVTGQVELDGPQLTQLVEAPGGAAAAQAVVLHELSHLVGLAHVDDPAQLMYPQVRTDVTTLGDGDRAGLAALGRGRCVGDV